MGEEYESVDQCWFCKAWFSVSKLTKVRVQLESFTSGTSEKMVCSLCLKGLNDAGAPVRK